MNKIKKSLVLYLAYASQTFLALSILWTVGIMYRWDSLRTQLTVLEALQTMFSFYPVFFVTAFVASIALIPFLIASGWLPKIQRFVISIARWALVAIFCYGNFWLLTFWAYEVALGFGDNGKKIVLHVLVIIVGISLLVHYLYRKGKLGKLDQMQVAAVSLFQAVIAFSSVAFLLMVIENKLTYHLKPYLESYGFVLLIVFFVLYRRELWKTLDRARSSIVPALGLGGVSAIVLMISFFQIGVGQEIEIVQPKNLITDAYGVEHVIIVTYEAMQAPLMSVYGHERETTPNFERFAETSYVFEKARVGADRTLLSIPSMHTGILPYTSRLAELSEFFSGGNAIGYMPNVFDQLGWDTSYIMLKPEEDVDDIFRRLLPYNDAQDAFIDAYHGSELRQAIQRLAFKFPFLPAWLIEAWYEDVVGEFKFDYGLDSSDPPGSVKFNLAKDYISNFASENFFLWVHQFPIHTGYGRYGEFAGAFLEDLAIDYQPTIDAIDWHGPPYDESVEPHVQNLQLIYEEYMLATDDEFGRFMDYLEAEGLMENSMIIVSADHGEAFSKGEIMHGAGLLYEQTLHVPLLIHMPGQAEEVRVEDNVQQVDLMPTILEVLGYSAPDWMDGMSLAPYFDGTADETLSGRATFSQTPPTVTVLTDVDVLEHLYTYAAYKNEYKLIHRFLADFYLNEVDAEDHPEFDEFFTRYSSVELFNLEEDPEESTNLVDAQPEIAAELMELIEGQIEKTRDFREAEY